MPKIVKNKSRNNDSEKVFIFLEDLCWLLDANKNIDFGKIPLIVSELKNNSLFSSSIVQDKDKVVVDLIGVIPSLLKDQTLFSSNSSIVEFSSQVLQLSIPRWEKKSRYELIGLIVSNIDEIDSARLTDLSLWLDKLMKNKDQIKRIQNEKTDRTFSWNEAIQKLLGQADE